MIVHNELRVNVDVVREFDTSSFDESSIMSCPSFASSTSSGSRRDSVTSLPYDHNYAHESHSLPFTGPSAFLDMDQVPSMTQEDLDMSLDPLTSDKTAQFWNVSLSGLRLAEARNCEVQQGQSLDYNHGYSHAPVRQVPPDSSISRSMIEGFQMDSNLPDCNMPEFMPNGTIEPSVAFGNGQYAHAFSPLTTHSESTPPCLSEQCSHSVPEGRAWPPEQLLYDQTSSPRPRSESLTSPPQPMSNQQTTSRPYRTLHKPKVTKVGKYGIVEDCPGPRIPCKYKDITGCNARFQRPEHLTRHLKSAAHSKETPYVCELKFCVDRKTGLRTSFNRKDNKHAHIVNCHLMDSDKPRRDRIRDMKQIEELGWTPLLPMKAREEQKRKEKALEAAHEASSRPKGGGRAKRSVAGAR